MPNETEPPQISRIFVSYSHVDKKWLSRFKTVLKPLIVDQAVVYWDDTSIKPGSYWNEEIEQALEACQIAVLLVSPNFLASSFVTKCELPYILNTAAAGGLTIIWVYISACLYHRTSIKDYQAAHDISRPLDTLSKGKQNIELVKVGKSIESNLQ